MALQVFWTIQFKSLRAGDDYRVSIYKDGIRPSGYPLTLHGAEIPFITEEDASEDPFIPIRTQTGYLRIVDIGTAINSNNVEVAFDWKELLPSTDTDRPVLLEKKVGSTWQIVWQGFMQAQNFGGTLYGGPQERELPLQCPLTVTQGTDINYQQTGIQNFAYLLKQVVDSIPSVARPTNFMIQGGADAQAWLMKRIDWQNFVSENGEGNLVARFSMYQCLEDMCRFWGWTARTCGTTMYLTCADDTAETTFLALTTAQLATLAAGTTAGDTSATFTTATLTGDIFANMNQNDYLQRGPNKAIVTASSQSLSKVVDYAPEALLNTMAQGGSYNESYDNTYVNYSNDILSFDYLLKGSAVTNKGSFNLMTVTEKFSTNDITDNKVPVFRLKGAYNAQDTTPRVSLETKYEHVFHNGQFTIFGDIYHHGEKYRDVASVSDRSLHHGNKTMLVSIGVGQSRNSAIWYNGTSWVATRQKIMLTIGNESNQFYNKVVQGQNVAYRNYINLNTSLSGYLFIDFWGSEDYLTDGDDHTFEVADFNVVFQKGSANPRLQKTDTNFKWLDSKEYIASNGNKVRDEFNADCIYASDNWFLFGLGLIANPDNSYLEEYTYGGTSLHPEQHLANRVVNYWATAKRRLGVDLRTPTIPDITPQYKVTIDGTQGCPIAITRDYWNDITTLTILEI